MIHHLIATQQAARSEPKALAGAKASYIVFQLQKVEPGRPQALTRWLSSMRVVPC